MLYDHYIQYQKLSYYEVKKSKFLKLKTETAKIKLPDGLNVSADITQIILSAGRYILGDNVLANRNCQLCDG